VGHRLEPGDDLADRGGLGVGSGRGHRAGGGGRGRRLRRVGVGSEEAMEDARECSYQRSWAGWPGLTATKVP
jgi:hypothetical protein